MKNPLHGSLIVADTFLADRYLFLKIEDPDNDKLKIVKLNSISAETAIIEVTD